MAAEIEMQPGRDRLEELLGSPRFAAALQGGSLTRVVEDGAVAALLIIVTALAPVILLSRALMRDETS